MREVELDIAVQLHACQHVPAHVLVAVIKCVLGQSIALLGTLMVCTDLVW